MLFALALVSSLGTYPALPAQTWPMYQYEPEHNAVFAQPDWHVQWAIRLGGKNNGSLSIVGNTLFVESFDHYVTSIDAQTGKVVWKTLMPGTPMNTPVVASGIVYAGTGRGYTLRDGDNTGVVDGVSSGDWLYALDTKTGAPIWAYRSQGEIMPASVISSVGNTPEIVFASGDQQLQGLEASSGRTLWKSSLPGVDLMSSLALVGDRIFGVAGYEWPYLFKAQLANDTATAANFQHTWSYDTAGNRQWTAPFGNNTCSPTYGDGRVFVEAQVPVAPPNPGNLDWSEVDAIDAVTAEKLWTYASPIKGVLSDTASDIHAIAGLYSQGTFYESIPFARQFAAFNGATGSLEWSVPTHGMVKMSAVLHDGLLYFGDDNNHFYIVQAESGAIVRDIWFPSYFGVSPPVIVGATLFVTNGAALYATPLDTLMNPAFQPAYPAQTTR